MPGLDGLGGGIGAFAQAFMQGRLLKEQIAGEHIHQQAELQQVEENKIKNASDSLSAYRTLAQHDPTLLKNPDFVQNVNKAGAPLGVNYGSALPDTFGKMSVDDFLTKGGASVMSELRQEDPATRSMFKGKIAGIPDDSPFWTNDAVITNQAALAKYPDMITHALKAAVDTGTPDSFVSFVNSTAHRFQMDPGAILTPDVTQQLVNSATAKARKVAAETGLTEEKAREYIKLTESTVTRNLAAAAQGNAQANLANVRAVELPRQVSAEITRASAAAQSAANGQQRITMELNQIAQLGGVDPKVAGQFNATMGRLESLVKSDQSTYNSLNNQWLGLVKSMNWGGGNAKVKGPDGKETTTGAIVQQLQQQAAAAKKRITDNQALLDGYKKGGWKTVVDRERQGMGLPGNHKQVDNTQTQTWRVGGKPMKVTSKDGGQHWYNSMGQEVIKP